MVLALLAISGKLALIETEWPWPLLIIDDGMQASFFGYMGIASALVFASNLFWCFNDLSDLGAAYGTAKSGVGISSMGVLKPELIFKSIVPIIMAGILGIYGLIVAVILQGSSKLYLL